MEFSDLYKQSNGALVRFSPSGEYVAVAVEHRLIVRATQAPKQIHRVFGTTYTTRPFIEALEWSPCGQFLLTASYAQSRVDLWALSDDTWRCSLVDEVCRVERAQWGLDAQHVLTHSELGLRLTVWSLQGGAQAERQYVQYPRAVALGSEHYAVAFRHEHRDVVGVYSSAWRLVSSVAVEQVRDIAGMRWSPDGLHLCVWGPSSGYALAVVNLAGVVKRQEVDDARLGVRDVAWSAEGQLLAVEALDGGIRVLNYLTWRPVATLRARARVAGNVDVFSETPTDSGGGSVNTHFALLPTPTDLPTASSSSSTSAAATASTEQRPGFLGFSADGTLLAQHSILFPRHIFVWRVIDMHLVCVLGMLAPVRMCRWSPVENTLAVVVAQGNNVYVWKSKMGCHLFGVPVEVQGLVGIRWCPSGEALAVVARGVFALAYVSE